MIGAIIGRSLLNQALPYGLIPGQFSLAAFMAAQTDGLWIDYTELALHWQTTAGQVLADSAGNPIGLSLDPRTWDGKTFAQVMTAQPELVANGDFATNTIAGWVNSSLGTGSVDASSGAAVLSFTDAANRGKIEQSLAHSSGVTLKHSFAVSGTGSVDVELPGGYVANYSAGTYTQFTVASGVNQKVSFLAAGASAVTVDNISVKLVPGQHALQATAGLRPLRQVAGGYSGAKFDGADDNQLTTYKAGSGANWIMALVTVPATLAARQVIIGANDVTATNNLALSIETDGKVSGAIGAQTQTTIKGTTDVRGQTLVIGLAADGTTVQLFVGGVAIEYSGAQSGAPTTATALMVGANNNNGAAANFFAGHVHKWLAGRSALTPVEYIRVRGRLTA